MLISGGRKKKKGSYVAGMPGKKGKSLPDCKKKGRKRALKEERRGG